MKRLLRKLLGNRQQQQIDQRLTNFTLLDQWELEYE